MVINNGVLTSVSESDVDENGYILIPAEVKIVETGSFASLKNLKCIEFSEGLEEVNYEAFSALPNLNKVIFPNSTKIIGSLPIVRVFNLTPNLNDVQLGLNVPFTKFAFGLDLTLKIIEQRLSAIEQILNNPKLTEEELLYAMSIYDNTIIHNSFLSKNHMPLKNKFDDISLKLIAALKNKSSNGKEIGHNLIQTMFEQNKMIPPSLLNYDTYNLYKSLGLLKDFHPIVFGSSSRGACMSEEDNVLTLDIQRIEKLFKNKTGESAKSNNELNIFLLFITRHETIHLYHRTRNPKSPSIDDKKMLIMSKLQKIQDGYEKGYPSNHIASHDCFPDEIDADLSAIELLSQTVIQKYNYEAFPMEAYAEKYEARKTRAYREVGIENGEDLIFAVMNNALASDRLSQSERSKLEQLMREYKNIYGNNPPQKI